MTDNGPDIRSNPDEMRPVPGKPASVSLRWNANRLPYTILSVVIILDQASKLFARLLMEPGKHYHILGNLFGLTLHRNNGVAFGMFARLPDYYSVPIFTIITSAAILYICRFYRRISPRETVPRVALMLILGGAFGNLADRLLTGRVTDFLEFARYAPEYRNLFPVFNLADVFIITGVILLFYAILTDRDFGKFKPEPGQSNPHGKA